MGQRVTSRLLLVRHCEAPSQGPDSPLTERGAAAAARLSAQLASYRPDAVYASPYARAIATVRPFSEQSGQPIAIDARIRERQLSAEPLPDWLDHLKKSYRDVHYRAPGGESLREVQERALAVLSEITSRHAFAVVASHGQWISSVLHHIDRSFGFDSWRSLQNPDLFVLSWDTGSPIHFERVAVET